MIRLCFLEHSCFCFWPFRIARWWKQKIRCRAEVLQEIFTCRQTGETNKCCSEGWNVNSHCHCLRKRPRLSAFKAFLPLCHPRSRRCQWDETCHFQVANETLLDMAYIDIQYKDAYRKLKGPKEGRKEGRKGSNRPYHVNTLANPHWCHGQDGFDR